MKKHLTIGVKRRRVATFFAAISTTASAFFVSIEAVAQPLPVRFSDTVTGSEIRGVGNGDIGARYNLNSSLTAVHRGKGETVEGNSHFSLDGNLYGRQYSVALLSSSSRTFRASDDSRKSSHSIGIIRLGGADVYNDGGSRTSGTARAEKRHPLFNRTFFRKKKTFTVGIVPVSVAAELGAEAGVFVSGAATVSNSIRDGRATSRDATRANLGGYARAYVEAEASVGIPVPVVGAEVGVNTNVSLLEVDIHLKSLGERRGGSGFYGPVATYSGSASGGGDLTSAGGRVRVFADPPLFPREYLTIARWSGFNLLNRTFWEEELKKSTVLRDADRVVVR